MNKQFLMNSRGQVQAVFAATIAIIVLFVAISLGLAITNNFYTGTGQTPQFSGLWGLVASGVGILVLVILLLRLMA